MTTNWGYQYRKISVKQLADCVYSCSLSKIISRELS